jgi:hypothetical protein
MLRRVAIRAHVHRFVDNERKESIMEISIHDMPGLFAQLGLPSELERIEAFIGEHRPLSESMALPDAPFWSRAQGDFLREEWKQDSAWIPVIDQLNASLR